MRSARRPDRNNFKKSKKNTYLARNEYDVDHTLPLAKHWADGGFNTTQPTRHRIAGGAGNLALMHMSLNRSKGAEGATYNPKHVGPAFTGPGKHPHEADVGVLFKNWR